MYTEQKRESFRYRKLAAQLTAEIGTILRSKICDYKFRDVSITRSEMSRDSAFLILYIRHDAEALLPELAEAHGQIRKALSTKLSHMRRMPDFRFKLDRTKDQDEILSKIDQLNLPETDVEDE